MSEKSPPRTVPFTVNTRFKTMWFPHGRVWYNGSLIMQGLQWLLQIAFRHTHKGIRVERDALQKSRTKAPTGANTPQRA